MAYQKRRELIQENNELRETLETLYDILGDDVADVNEAIDLIGEVLNLDSEYGVTIRY